MSTHKDNCLICQILQGKIPSKPIFEDDHVTCILDINGAVAGHCFVIPKAHYPIIEQVPEELFAHAFEVANRVSVALFEQLNVEGTNIFVTNGIAAGQTIAHTMLQVIPRKKDDGISLTWQPKQMGEEEMSTVELKLKELLGSSGGAVAPAPSAPVTAAAAPAKRQTRSTPAAPVSFSDYEQEEEYDTFRRMP